MNRVGCLLLAVMFCLSGCEQAPQQRVTIEELNIVTLLGLSESESFQVYEYSGDTLLFLIYDREKRNPIEGGREELWISSYLEKFVLWDVPSHKIAKEIPVEQFGFPISAVYAFDRVLFSCLTEISEGNFQTSIRAFDEQGQDTIYVGGFSRYADGPFLHQVGGDVLFSYRSGSIEADVYDTYEEIFEFQKINANLEVTMLAPFAPEQIALISSDFAVSNQNYAFLVGAYEGDHTFYIGSDAKAPVQITLPEETVIYSYTPTQNAFLVTRDANSDQGGPFCMDRFDLAGNSLERFHLPDGPPQGLCANDRSQFCGFNNPLRKTPLEIFEITDSIHPIEADVSMIDSTWNNVLTNGDDFVVYSLDYPNRPNIWLVSIP